MLAGNGKRHDLVGGLFSEADLVRFRLNAAKALARIEAAELVHGDDKRVVEPEPVSDRRRVGMVEQV